MVTLVNRAKVATSTTGTGAVSLGAAEDGYQTFADAGLTGNEDVRYTIEDGDDWEIGTGGINGAVSQMSRTLIESSTGSKLNLSGNAVVYVTAAGQDIVQPSDLATVATTGDYDDLTDKPTLGTAASADTGDFATAAQGSLADSAVQPNDSPTFGSVSVTGTVDGRDVASDGSKLDGIEANANVTDTANVTAAGALMDSEVANLAQVKAFDSADYATAAQGSLADSALQSGDNVSALTNDAGYTTNVGDITGVTAGSGITGGGTSGTVTVNHADTSSQSSVNNSGATFVQDVTLDTYGHVTGLGSATITPATIGAATSAQGSLADSATQPGDNISTLTNDAGYTTNVGDITGVTAGTDMTGGGSSGTVTINHADTSTLSGTYGSTSNGTKIDQITVDARGHVTAITTGATGDIQGVTAGTGLTGGGTSGTVTLNGVTQSEATWEAGTSTTESLVSPSKVKAAISELQSNNGWVNFNGTGTVSIRADSNVSSITDLGVGQYRVNFSTAISDANFSCPISIQVPVGRPNEWTSNYLTTSVDCVSFRGDTNTYSDTVIFSVSVFR